MGFATAENHAKLTQMTRQRILWNVVGEAILMVGRERNRAQKGVANRQGSWAICQVASDSQGLLFVCLVAHLKLNMRES